MRRRSAPGDSIDTSLDSRIGERVRARRKLRGVTQQELAAALGVTFQQVQKYEHAANRISATTLQAIGDFLGAPVVSFYDPRPEAGDNNEGDLLMARLLSSQEGLDVAKSFVALPPSKVRSAIAELLTDLALSDEQEAAGRLTANNC